MDKLVRAARLGNVQSPVFALAWFVSATFAVLVGGVAMPLARSVRRPGALATCGIVATRLIAGTRCLGCLGLAAWRAHR